MDRHIRRGGALTPLVLFFVLCCGILACVFARAADLSAQAGRLNTAVQICRNGGEIFTGCGSPEQTQQMLGGPYFALDGTPVPEEEAGLVLTIRAQEENGVSRAVLTVCDVDGETVYDLAVSVCSSQITRKEGRP